MGTWKILLVISTYPAQHGSIQTPNPQVLYIKKTFLSLLLPEEIPACWVYIWLSERLGENPNGLLDTL